MSSLTFRDITQTMAPSKPEVREIEIALIDVGEQQVRESPADEAIGELAESIASKGLLQPIGVTIANDGRYQLRWGHRRLLAHQRLGRAKIRAGIYDGPEESIKGLAFVENLHRSAMTMADEIAGVAHLVNTEGKSVEQVAAIMNKGRSWVLNRLMVPDLPDYLREPLLAGDLPMSHVEIISRVPDPGAQSYLTSQALAQRWNRSQLKTIAECYMISPSQPEPTTTGTPGVNPNPVNSPFMYTCQMCEEKGLLDQFDLVRIHKDGYGCRATSNRPDNQSHSEHEVERHIDGHDRTLDQNHDRES